ncbi:penicillin-binding protein activator [Guyparkeria sp. TX1]|uniref:penicillin-binding protein activator n=1 Tax=Guyparkeria sp. TX1 TaxID=3115001 RepID=UPI003977C951
MPTRPSPLAHSATRLALLATLLTVGGCAQMTTSPQDDQRQTAQVEVDQAISAEDPAALARARMALSQTLSGAARAEQQLNALETAIDAHELELARELYQQADTQARWDAINSRRASIARGLGEWSSGNPEQARRTIHRIPLPLDPDSERRRLILLGALEAELGNPLTAARYYDAVDDQLDDKARETNHARLWNLLTEVPADQLRREAEQTGSRQFAGWLELALTYRQQPGQIDRWAANYPGHPAIESGLMEMLGATELMGQLTAPAKTGPVAVILPEGERYAGITREIRAGIEFARENGALGGREVLFFDSGSDRIGASAAIEEAQRAGVALIIGPLLKEQLGALASLPAGGPLAIALNSPPSGESLPGGVVSFSLSPEQDAAAVAQRMWTDGHRRAAIFSADHHLGERTRQAFANEFELLGGEVVDRARFASGQTDFSSELRSLLRVRTKSNDGPFQPIIRGDLDAIFLAASGDELALVVPQLDYFGADDLPRYGLGLAYNGNRDRRGDADKNGVIIPIAPLLLAGTAGPENPLRITYERAQLAGPLPRLFAFGADAAALAGRMEMLLQGGTLDGLTGELSVTATGLVERQPRWGQFRQGLIRPLDPTSDAALPGSLTSPARLPGTTPPAGQNTDGSGQPTSMP